MSSSEGRRKQYGVVASLVVLAGALGGCGENADMQVQLHPEGRLPSVNLEVEDNQGIRTFDRSQLNPSGVNSHLATHVFEVTETGTIRVRVRVEEQGETVASGEVDFQAVEDFDWNVTVAFDTENPIAGCFGCMGAEAFPVAEAFRTAPAESLWVWWGGKRKGSDAIF